MKRLNSVKDFAEYVLKSSANESVVASKYMVHKVRMNIIIRFLKHQFLCNRLKAGIKHVV